MAYDDFNHTPRKYDDIERYASRINTHLTLRELKFCYKNILIILKQLNECSIVSHSSSSYERSVRGSKIMEFIKKLEEDKYLEEANLFKKLIGKNNRFYTSPKRLIHLLTIEQFNKIKELIESDYFNSTFIFSREDNVSYLDLYIKSNKKLKFIEVVNKEEEK